MDRIHLEPADWLHQSQRWVQELLCRADGEAVAGYAAAALHRRVPACAARGFAGIAAFVEEAANDLCQFDERFIS